jgi:poly(3-hydroxybutyrate) depolymerase
MSVELDVDGTARTYELSIPAEYDPATPYPVVFAFHGRGGDGALAALYFGVEAQAAGAAIFVYPDGLPLANMGNQTGWDLTANGVDVAFFDALRAELDAQLCLDPERLFATGHSFGGYFSNTLGCARGDVLRAIAPVAGGGPFFTCNTPVAAWIAHGNLDETVPVSEGEGSRDTWLGYDGCGATSQPTSPAPCVAYDGCSAGTPVVWCAHDEPDMGGHAWPSFAAEGIWGFFAGL